MCNSNEQSPAFPTWVLKTKAYSKRVIPKDGLVFEMSLLDGRYAIGFVLIAKFGGFRAPLTEILAICKPDYDPNEIDQKWVNSHHTEPFLPPICIEPFMFSKLGMIRRLRILESPVSRSDILRYKGFTTLDPSARRFVPDKKVGTKYISQPFRNDMENWEYIDHNRNHRRLTEVENWETKLLVPSDVPLAGNYDLIVAKMIAYEEDGELPTVERSKVAAHGLEG